MELLDGTIVRKLSPIGVQGKEHWKAARTIAFGVDPIFDADSAAAHTQLGAPSAVIVLVKRGPKGGWPYAKFVNEVTGASWLRKAQAKGYTIHLGKIVSA